MKKRAISASVTLLLICFQAGAQTLPQRILQCSGSEEWKGINAPKDAGIPQPDPSRIVGGTYTFQGNVLVKSDEGKVADQRYKLCSVTTTNYVYSTDCSIDTAGYIAEWLKVSTAASDTAFQARHKESWVQLDTVIVDRVNLSLDEMYVAPLERSDYDPEKANALVLTPYLLSTHYVATCHLAQPQF